MKKLSFAGVVTLLGISLLVGVLRENFGPWVQTGRDGLADQLIELVGKKEFQLNQAKAKITEYESVVVKQAQQRVALKSLVGRVNESVETAQTTVAENRSQLASIRRKLVGGDVVFASTGSAMNNTQVKAKIESCERAIEMAEHREASMTQLRNMCQVRLDHLTIACEQVPQRLRELHEFCSDLESKIVVAKDMKTFMKDMNSIGSHEPEFEKIRNDLLSVSNKIDGELEGLSNLMTVRLGDGGIAPETDDLITRIEKSLQSSPSDRILSAKR